MAWQAWTRQAWHASGYPGACDSFVAWQHKDWAVRNMVLINGCGCGSCSSCIGDGSTELAERNRRRSNVPWCPWPTYEDVVQWAHSEGVMASRGEDETSNSAALQAALLAAIDDISEDTALPYYVVDDDYEVVLDDAGQKTLAEVPARVHLATMMHAARLYKRRHSQEGTLGSSAFGGAIRVARYDPDVRNLLHNWLRKGVA